MDFYPIKADGSGFDSNPKREDRLRSTWTGTDGPGNSCHNTRPAASKAQYNNYGGGDPLFSIKLMLQLLFTSK